MAQLTNISSPCRMCSVWLLDTIIDLYKKLDSWLSADEDEAHAEEYERDREIVKRFKEKWGHLSKKTE
jgi:hypothetical protein